MESGKGGGEGAAVPANSLLLSGPNWAMARGNGDDNDEDEEEGGRGREWTGIMSREGHCAVATFLCVVVLPSPLSMGWTPPFGHRITQFPFLGKGG